MSNFASFRRRRIDGVLQRFGISDDALLEALIEAADEIRAFQIDNEPRNSNHGHPMIKLLHDITGLWVPEAATESVLGMIAKLGADATPEKLSKAWSDWIVKGRDTRDWRWVMWAAYVGKGPARRPSAATGTKTGNIMEALNILGINGNGE